MQALYQMDLAETDLAEVIEEFKDHRLGNTENDTAAQADPEHFASLLKGVVRCQREIDPMIDRQLAEGWRLTRIDSRGNAPAQPRIPARSRDFFCDA